MPDQSAIHGVMEGGGSYNLHAKIPAVGSSLALPLLQHAVQDIPLDGDDRPIVIADYGSSQGKNSLAPVRAAIRVFRERLGPGRPIIVVHIDQAANDFNTLFSLLSSDPERYSVGDPNIFPSAIGRSFYENVFPKEHVHLAWSSYAAVWLSRIPMTIPGHFVALASSGDVRAAFERQAAEDWKFFLSLRSHELRTGGRLVVVLPGVNEDGPSGFENLFTAANAALTDMVHAGAVTAEERARMVLGTYPRRKSELLAPFTAGAQFRGLTVERCEVSTVPDAAWADYECNGDKQMLAARHAGFFRAVFVPSLASAIRNPVRSVAFADGLEQRLKQRLADQPKPLHSFVQTIVLIKKS